MTMTAEEMFTVWAPDNSVWSRWSKPVLFVNLPANRLQGTSTLWRDTDVHWTPSPGSTAVVVDLPGAQSVATGIALAMKGYRPVPLYNSCNGPAPVVNLSELMDALADGTEELKRRTLHEEAPPAFLLDSQRMTGTPLPARFDNRWMAFPQDFPSASFLLSKGIRRVLLVSQSDRTEDLAHVFLRWQEAGIELYIKNPLDGFGAKPLIVTAPSRYRSMWYRVLALVGLRRASVGGFGAVVPTPGQPGGSGYRGFG
jgi:hypothetical protein